MSLTVHGNMAGTIRGNLSVHGGGFLRNVAVALGNSGDRAAVPALIAALRDPEPLVRAHVAWALDRLGGEEAREAMTFVQAAETDPLVESEYLKQHGVKALFTAPTAFRRSS